MSRKKKTDSAKNLRDPFAEREAQKYANPIPSRELIIQQLADSGVPMTRNDIAACLDIKADDEDRQEALRRRLKAMERDGQIIRNRRGDYGLPKKMNLIKGRVIGHPDGYGFLVPEEGGSDLFLSEKQMRGLLHGDLAMVNVVGIDRKGRREGALVEVLERANQSLVGRFFSEHGVNFVEANNRRIAQDILIPPENTQAAQHGQIVTVQLIEQPNKHHPPVGRIVEILGDHMDPGMSTDIAIRDHSIPSEWSPEVEQAAAKLPSYVPSKAKKNREDLRALPLVTIDGETARDFDDAVYCEPQGKGWRLLVAIADVSHYVKPDSALDAEAKTRGTSVYFPDRVVPMLPEALSNGLCSLNPQVDRLCMVCEMSISHHGTMRRSRFFAGVMNSHARLTYTQVAAALDGDAQAVPADILPHLQHLQQLYQLLSKRREKRGALDFDTTETRIVFDDQKKISSIVPVVRNDAHRLIEEMMLLANVATAEFLAAQEMPLLYRVHEGPSEDKLTELRTFLGALGLRLYGGDAPQAKHYAKLIDGIRERPDRHMIQTVLLRSLRMAVYTPNNAGHFGLSYEAYAHFTSPIRRYPDLLVHRAIRHCLEDKLPATFRYGHEDMEALGEHCSTTERRADEATRDVVAWLKCEYMRDKVGDVYTGTVTAVTAFGLFVELDDIFIEGLVHVTALKNDYYQFDPTHHCLKGERGGKVYRLSDRLEVKVVRVDLDEKKIDFVLAE